jgi:hypothetical protein
LATSAAAQQILPATVTAVPQPGYDSSVVNYNGSLSLLTDGVAPADGSAYNGSNMVWFDNNLTAFNFDFGGLVSIDSLLATVDNNDYYFFDFYNNGVFVGFSQINPAQGSVNNGVETFSFAYGSPILATSARVSAGGGDTRNGIGEVQFGSSTFAAAVPEPATWAMMLVGFGGIGFSMRRQRKHAALAQIA